MDRPTKRPRGALDGLAAGGLRLSVRTLGRILAALGDDDENDRMAAAAPPDCVFIPTAVSQCSRFPQVGSRKYLKCSKVSQVFPGCPRFPMFSQYSRFSQVSQCSKCSNDMLFASRKILKIFSNPVAQMLHKGGQAGRSHQYRIEKALDDFSQTHTPYGNLLEEVHLPCKSGGTLSWWIANPLALIWFLGSVSAAFGEFLFEHIDRVARISLWGDETVAGNPLRPDNANKFLAVYFSFTQLPGFFRTSDYGWWPIGVLHYEKVKELKCGYSTILKHTLEKMFLGTVSFSLGVMVPMSGASKLLQGKLWCLVQDEKAHKDGQWIKGAAGTKCCGICANIFNGDPEKAEVSEHVFHYATAMPEHFKALSDQDVWIMCDKLTEAKPTFKKGMFNKLQQVYGINYSEDSLLFDKRLRGIFLPVSHTFYDWMHIMFASGGVAAIICNCFCMNFVRSGGTLEQLDLFAQRFRGSSAAFRPLREKFFRERVNTEKPTEGPRPMKVFAGECITAVMILAYYCATVLDADGRLREDSMIMRCLAVISEILVSGDKALTVTRELSRMFVNLHKMLIRFYTPKVAKAKPITLLSFGCAKRASACRRALAGVENQSSCFVLLSRLLRLRRTSCTTSPNASASSKLICNVFRTNVETGFRGATRP